MICTVLLAISVHAKLRAGLLGQKVMAKPGIGQVAMAV